MQRGFTLIELSVVLVILGLITGGIVIGQSLLRTAEIKAINIDLRKYVTAITTFQTRFEALPGDMANATTYWGALSTNATTCRNTATPNGSTLTCNGDGDGRMMTNVSSYEIYRAWQQLANAGMVDGKYTGISANLSLDRTSSPGINVPRFRNQDAGYSIDSVADQITGSNWFAGSYINIMEIGQSASNNATLGAILTPAETMAFDSKYDNGLPGTGSVRTMSPNYPRATNCATNDTLSATYNLAYDEEACSILYNIF